MYSRYLMPSLDTDSFRALPPYSIATARRHQQRSTHLTEVSGLPWAVSALSSPCIKLSRACPATVLGHLGLSWDCLIFMALSWAAAGLSQAILGTSWHHLGLSWAILGPSWAIFRSEASARLFCLWGPFAAVETILGLFF